jgi:hypothetical protein
VPVGLRLGASRRGSDRAGPKRLLVPVGALALAVIVLAGCSSARNPAGEGTAVELSPIPLTSSTAGTETTWATLAMGHLDDPLNTFWQLVALTGGSDWQLATPPGVASNGGLVAATGTNSVLAGFEPSQDLRFSPLARSGDQGSSWAPGTLSAGLARVPEALAEGDGGHSLALLRSSAGTVVGNDGDLSTWTPVTSANRLAVLPGPRGCHLVGLTAVAFDAAGSPLVGASCDRGGQAGIFTSTPTGWESVGPGIPGGGGGPTEVIRLDQTATATGALVVVGGGGNARLVALWSGNGLRTWTVSAGQSLDGGALLSTGLSPDGGFVIASKGSDGTVSAWTVGGSATQWQPLARLPSGTTSVTSTPDGGYDALVPQQSTLEVYGLASTGWGRVQSLRVPIQYGSSN